MMETMPLPDLPASFSRAATGIRRSSPCAAAAFCEVVSQVITKPGVGAQHRRLSSVTEFLPGWRSPESSFLPCIIPTRLGRIRLWCRRVQISGRSVRTVNTQVCLYGTCCQARPGVSMKILNTHIRCECESKPEAAPLALRTALRSLDLLPRPTPALTARESGILTSVTQHAAQHSPQRTSLAHSSVDTHMREAD